MGTLKFKKKSHFLWSFFHQAACMCSPTHGQSSAASGSCAHVASAAELPPATERDRSGLNTHLGGLVEEESAWATELSDALQD